MEAHSLARTAGGLALPRSRKLLSAFGDERLVEQLRRGNEVAFEVLYDRHHRGVLSYCRHMLGSRDEAEDALQQAFVSAHTDIVTSDKPIRFKAWIYTIARNRCLSILRARREQPTEDLDRVSTAGLSDEVQHRADLKELLVDMHDLPEDQRAALVLSELGDLSHGEVAEVIGCEAAKVKSLVFQARSGLIERREARETPCEEIREQLATLRGGSLRRGPLRRHLKACPGCQQFREEVRRQRQMVAAVLPVIPTLGLKESALAAVGIGAGSAGGGALIGGGGALVAAKASAAKVAVIAVAAGGAVGGGVAVQQQATGDRPESRSGAIEQREAAPAAPGVGSIEAAAPAARDEAAREKAARDGVLVADERGGKGKEKQDGKLVAAERARGEKKGKDGGKRGLEPTRGESNGERARDFARGHGKGRHRGLDKQEARAGKTRRGRSESARGERGRSEHARDRPRPERKPAKPPQAQRPERPPRPAGPFSEGVPPPFDATPPPAKRLSPSAKHRSKADDDRRGNAADERRSGADDALVAPAE